MSATLLGLLQRQQRDGFPDLAGTDVAATIPVSERLNLDRQFAHADACGVVDRRSDGRCHARQTDLADAARAELVDLLVRKAEEMHVDRRHVGVDRHHVVGQIAVRLASCCGDCARGGDDRARWQAVRRNKGDTP